MDEKIFQEGIFHYISIKYINTNSFKLFDFVY